MVGRWLTGGHGCLGAAAGDHERAERGGAAGVFAFRDGSAAASSWGACGVEPEADDRPEGRLVGVVRVSGGRWMVVRNARYGWERRCEVWLCVWGGEGWCVAMSG